MALPSFASTLYGQCCRRHVVGQRVVRGGLKLQEWTMAENITGVDNARVDNDGTSSG